MVAGLLKLCGSIVWAIALFAIFEYVFVCYFLQVVLGQAYRPHVASDQVLRRRFGGFFRAMLTLFLAVTGGTDWEECFYILYDIHPLHSAVFALYVFVATYGAANIITGIFVDDMIASARCDKEEVVRAQIRSRRRTLQDLAAFFHQADTDGNNEITFEELQNHLAHKEVRAHLNDTGIELQDAEALFHALDMHETGSVTLEEFVQGMVRLVGHASKIDFLLNVAEQRHMMVNLTRILSGQQKRTYEEIRTLRGMLDGEHWVHHNDRPNHTGKGSSTDDIHTATFEPHAAPTVTFESGDIDKTSCDDHAVTSGNCNLDEIANHTKETLKL